MHEKYYEEILDHNLEKLLPRSLQIEKVNALKITKPRLIGDIGLRAFFQLYKKAKQLIKSEKIDFLYIPIPSFYCALLGRWLHFTTKIKYGVDYIDPWVHQFPGSNKRFSRHWLSTRIACFLEPIAIKRASLITGVAEGYYADVLKRNPHLRTQAFYGAMPYGGEAADNDILNQLHIDPYLFRKNKKLQLVYAGAMLPNAYEPLEAVFKAMVENKNIFEHVELHFIGTGSLANDPESYNIKPLAEKYDLFNSIVYEYPRRIPYLDVLVHLKSADGVFVLGSTEAHYTPSKVYQAVLAQKPILAVLHKDSTAVEVINKSGAGIVLAFDGKKGIDEIQSGFTDIFIRYKSFIKNYSNSTLNQEYFEMYSAKEVTRQLANLLNKIPINS